MSVHEGPTPARDAENQNVASRKAKGRLRFVLVPIAILAGVAGVAYYLHTRGYESTDDAFLDGNVVRISPRVPGFLLELRVTDNLEVAEGDLLVELDPAPYVARLDQARAAEDLARSKQQAAEIAIALTHEQSSASIDEQLAAVRQAEEALATATAQIEVARAEARKAQADLARAKELGPDIVPPQQQDLVKTQAESSAARLIEALKQQAAAEAGVDVAKGRLAGANTADKEIALRTLELAQQDAELAKATAAVRSAELDLSYARIYAPAAGRITRRSVDKGEFIQAGQTLFAIVPDEIWVVANFKETQLTHMRPGQHAEIKVDAFPGLRLRGHVDSIQAGTGSRFSLLPPENATGNYVKVVQRVPVKIVLDDPPVEQYHLAPGMSVVPKVYVK